MKIQSEFEKWFRKNGTHKEETWEMLLERKEGKYRVNPTNNIYLAFKAGYEAALKEKRVSHV